MFFWFLIYAALGNLKSVSCEDVCDATDTYTMHHDYFLFWDEYLQVPMKEKINPGDLCNPHHYCLPQGIFPCGYGSYSTNGTNWNVNCEWCPAGKYCFKDVKSCEPGYYCIAEGLPKEPPPGFYCPNYETTSPIKCPVGHYQRHIQHIKWHWRGISECEECPDHMFCDIEQLSTPAGFCEDGYYCEKGEQDPKPSGKKCGPGEYCVQGKKFLCEVGYYQPLEGQHECLECPEGMYCATEGLSSPSGLCDAGWYCGRRETESRPVSQKCSPGHMCPDAILIPCSKGYYQPSEGQIRCFPCPIGKYCQDIGLSNPSGDCDVGCCQDTAQISASSCPPASPTACTQGRYFNQDANACVLCPEGMYCAISGLTNPSGTCEPGWYCDRGEITPTPLGKLCPAGYQCSTGVKVVCSSWVRDTEPYAGQVQYLHQPERGQTSCKECPSRYNCTEQGLGDPSVYCSPGYWCYFGIIFDCEIGHYCLNGEMLPCRNGFKSVATNQESCVRCNDGELCENGQVLPCPANMVCYHGVAEFCDLGNLCSFVSGSYEITPCGASWERYDVSQTSCGKCRKTRYCRVGTSFECFRYHEGHLCIYKSSVRPALNLSPKGTSYHLTWSSQDENRGYRYYLCGGGTYQFTTHNPSCTMCTAGKYCQANGMGRPWHSCSAGYYCPKASKHGKACPAGSYCEHGGEFYLHCKKGTYQPDIKKGSCLPCPIKYYCDTPGLAAATAICPAGFTCPEGSADPTPCPKGTYQSETGATSCLDCTNRYYCPTKGVALPLICPSGSKCPGTGRVDHTLCPQGTYQSETGATSCLDCTNGYYCPTTGVSLPLICPRGSKCPGTGRVDHTPCPQGTYQSETGATSCLDCTNGYYCPKTGLSMPLICPSGWECPGTGIKSLCSVGTFSSNIGSTQCEQCSPGSFAANNGSVQCEQCTPGYYCEIQGLSAVTDICWIGHHCPEGVSVPIPCPDGYYQAETGKSTCNICPVHFYCNRMEAEAEKQSGAVRPTHGVVTPKECPPTLCHVPGSSENPCELDPFDKGELVINISCKPSCGDIMTAMHDLKFIAECDGCDVLTYKWSQRQCFSLDIEDCIHCKTYVTYLTKYTSYYTIIPHKDKKDWTYLVVTVKVTLKDGREGMAFHMWQYFDDARVECQISPVTGIAMQTQFNVTCTEPELPPNINIVCSMFYAYSVTGDSLIFQGNETCNHTGIVLRQGDKTKDHRQHLQVLGKYLDHLIWDVPVLLQVVMPVVTTESLGSAVDDLSKNFSASGSIEENVEILNELQAVIYVLNELPAVSNETGSEDTETGSDNASAEETEEETKEKNRKIRENVMSAITKVNTSNVEVMVAVTSTLNQITLKKEELSTELKDQAFETYSSFTEQFQQMEETTSDEDVKKTAATLLFGVGSVLDITTDDYPETPQEDEEGPVQSSPDVKPVTEKEKEENKQRVKERTEKLLKSVEAISDIVFKRQDIDSEPAVFETPILSIAVAKMSPKNLVAKPIKAAEGDEDSTTSLALPEDLDLSGTGESVRTEFMMMKKNPYPWGDNSRDIKPPVVSLELKDSHNHVLNISNLTSPIKVNLANDGGKVAGIINLLFTVEKVNESIALSPSRTRACAATFELTIEQEKVTSFSLSLPDNFTALLSIGLDKKFNASSTIGSGFSYPKDVDIIRKFYGYLSTVEADIFDNATVYCEACSEICCNTTEICTGFYEHCMYYCKQVIKNPITENCTETFDPSVYCETCQIQCCNGTYNCTGVLENCVFFCTLYMEDNITAECQNHSSVSSPSALDTTISKYCEDCDYYCCSGNEDCSDVYANCIFFCTNFMPENETFLCETSPKSVETIFLFPRESMAEANNGSYKMYFGLTADPTDIQVLEYFTQLDPTCLGNDLVNICTVDIDLQVPLKVSVMGCDFWDAANERWSTSGMQISRESHGDTLVCTSSHLTTFSQTMLVAPNFIDPLDFELFLTFFENPVVVTVVLVVWMLYFFLVHWARQKDKSDRENVGIIYCSDNVATHTYSYIVCIATGWWSQAGTTANVYIYLKGEVDNSPRKCLKTPVRKCFQTGYEDWFLITTEHSLGEIKSVTLWHDNTGSSPHWFVNQVFVKDITMDSSWTFVYNDWLAVDRGNLLMTTTTLQPVTEEELKLKRKFNFMVTSTQDLRDGHIWISVFSKSASNTFTRVQRLTCCLALLLTTMLTNLMFYGIPTDDPDDQLVTGGFRLSLSQIVIGIQSSLIMFPVNLLIVQLFTKVKERPPEEESPKPIEHYLEAIYGATWQKVMADIKIQLMLLTKTRDSEGMKFFTRVPRPPEKTVLEAFTTEMEKKKQGGKILPWWFVYIAWTIAVTTCIVSSYFVALYGLKYGYNRSVEWLVSFSTGFFQSVFVQQPIKVLGIAFILTLIFKKTVKYDDSVPERKLDLDEEYLHSVCIKPPETHQLVMEPLPKKLLDQIKERLRIEWFMDITIRDMILHIFYLAVILTMVHGHRNITQAFRNTETVRSMFVNPSDGFPLEEVTNADEFYMYLQETVVPAMTDITSDHEYATLGCNHYLVGTYRLRQLRIKREVCTPLMHRLPGVCKGPYSVTDEDARDYDQSWSEPLSHDDDDDDDDDDDEVDPWIHRSTWELQTLPHPGTHATYSGGGYVLDLPADVSLHSAIFNNLSAQGWIDDHTRAVFVEFTLYNPNVDLFTVALYLFEFTNVGRVFPINHEFTASLYHYSTNYQIVIAVCEVLFVCFTILIICVEAKKVRHVGKAEYFSDFWTFVELQQIALSIAMLGLFIKRFITVENALQEFKDTQGKRFINFYSAIFWDFVFGYVSAVLIAVVTLKTVKLVRYNKRIRIVTATLSTIRSVFLGYVCLFAILTVTFAQVGYLMFGYDMGDFNTFGNSWIAIIIILLGEGDFVGIQESFRFMGPLFIVVIIMTIQYGLMVMMTTILNVGRLEAKHELQKKKSKIALTKYIIGKIKLVLNMK